MAGYSRSAALRKALSLAPATPVIHPRPLFADPFTESDWQFAQQTREAIDSLLYPVRWLILVMLPGDTVPRRFVLCGSYESVCKRAALFFPQYNALTVQPARLQIGYGEFVDKRLHDLNQHRRIS